MLTECSYGQHRGFIEGFSFDFYGVPEPFKVPERDDALLCTHDGQNTIFA